MDPQLFQGGLVDPGAHGANLDPGKLTTLNGYLGLRRKHKVQRQIQIAEAANMWAQFVGGKIHPTLMLEAFKDEPADWMFGKLNQLAPHIFNEAMTRSDFTNLTTYVLDRMMYDNYGMYPKTYDQVCKVHNSVRDFRVVERWQEDGGELPYQKVGETSGFGRQVVKTGKYTYQVYKYEKGDQISWEATVNDDMDMFKDIPERLTVGGIRTIEQFWCSLIAGTTGPKSTFYGTAISLVTGGTLKNIIDLSAISSGTFTGQNNPPLTVLNLILACGIFMNQATAEGRPINISNDEMIVVVGDGILYQTLMNIINTNQIVTTILGGTKASSAVTSDLALQAKNWISGKIKPVYAPELRNIVTTNLATSYWLFAKPGSGRPAIELGFLSGYEAPQLYRKLPNTVRVNGSGGMDEMGDFETTSTELKGLIVFGGTSMDPRMTMASNGTGS